MHTNGVKGELPQGDGTYGTSIHYAMAMDPANDVLVAYMYNGQPMAPDHGFPVRIIIPGCIGGRMVSTPHKVGLAPVRCWQRCMLQPRQGPPTPHHSFHVPVVLLAAAWWAAASGALHAAGRKDADHVYLLGKCVQHAGWPARSSTACCGCCVRRAGKVQLSKPLSCPQHSAVLREQVRASSALLWVVRSPSQLQASKNSVCSSPQKAPTPCKCCAGQVAAHH